MGAISGSHCQTGALQCRQFTSCGLTSLAKSTLENQLTLASGGREYNELQFVCEHVGVLLRQSHMQVLQIFFLEDLQDLALNLWSGY